MFSVSAYVGANEVAYIGGSGARHSLMLPSDATAYDTIIGKLLDK